MFGIKNKNKVKSKGKIKTSSLKKELDILNYTPPGYGITRRWAEFSDPVRFDDIHRKKIKNLSVDELCGDMYDPKIRIEAILMKDCATEQRINNYTLIDHDKGILEGGLKKLNQILPLFEEDLKTAKDKTAELEALKKKGA